MGRAPKPLAERFWPKVEKSGPIVQADLGSCWVWTGFCAKYNGYGKMHVDTEAGKRSFVAHRVSWTLHFGEIPDGKEVLHRCDNPPCVRPDHLLIGTHTDNMRDMSAKGRSAAAALTAGQVREIRAALARGERKSTVADRFGTSRQNMTSIANGSSWRWV